MNLDWLGDLLLRVGPILVFLAGITVVAELSDRAGVFAAASRLVDRAGGRSIRRVWYLAVALASVTTILLSLDTTAVLLTPVVLALAKRLRLNAWPFALAAVWLANTASLLLPVSNLTNLLLIDKVGWSVGEYLARMWLPALVALAVSVAILAVVLRRDVRGSYDAPAAERAADRPLLITCASVCLLVGPAAIIGVPPWVAATVGAVIVIAAFAWRAADRLDWRLVPLGILAITIGLFVAVGLLHELGLTDWLSSAMGDGTSWAALLRVSAVATVASNVLNNLPAYLLLEPFAGAEPDRLLALLVGTNVGPLITMWGSLATLLWRDRCRAVDVTVSARRFAAIGLIGVPLLLVATTSAVWLTV